MQRRFSDSSCGAWLGRILALPVLGVALRRIRKRPTAPPRPALDAQPRAPRQTELAQRPG